MQLVSRVRADGGHAPLAQAYALVVKKAQRRLGVSDIYREKHAPSLSMSSSTQAYRSSLWGASMVDLHKGGICSGMACLVLLHLQSLTVSVAVLQHRPRRTLPALVGNQGTKEGVPT